ncbi:hypothetical protein GF312_12785 [Candidatus Poribacteria bacterium]|nr:hypothetical protein [Candidatus Poribacteria bacterium]
MKICSLSCLMDLIWSKERDKSRLKNIAYLSMLQTPVFEGERRDYVKEIKNLIVTLLSSEIFYFVLVMALVIGALYYFYRRKKSIPEMDVQVIPDDTWFTTRDDNNRIAIIVSLRVNNKSTRGITIKSCKLSGYSAKSDPLNICLKGLEDEDLNLDFPNHEHYCKGQEFYIGPFSTENIWVYFESRTVTMRNLLKAPLTIKDSEKRHKTIHLKIPRHTDQIKIYREMARMF